MSMTIVSLVLNVVIMALLGAMIYHSSRLSKSIDVFRKSRQEMEALIKRLSDQIDQANTAVRKLRRDSADSADDLTEVVAKSRVLSDELQYIYETGDRLASRLEALVEQSSGEIKKAYKKQGLSDEVEHVHKREEKKASASPFNIVDREYEDDKTEADDNFPSFLRDDDGDDSMSQAERELAEALLKKEGGARKKAGRS
jgi:uncharacterized protein YoxC